MELFALEFKHLRSRIECQTKQRKKNISRAIRTHQAKGHRMVPGDVSTPVQKVAAVGRTPPGCRGRRRHCCSGRARSSRWPPTGPGLRAGHAEGRTVPAQEQRNCQHAHPLNPPFPAPNSPCPRAGNCGQEPAGSQGQIRLTSGSVSGGILNRRT